MVKRWANFETQVRDIASRIYAKPCAPRVISGNALDGVIEERPDSYIFFEITVEHSLEKVRDDINKLILTRNSLFVKGIQSRLFMVLLKEPTPSMLAAGRENFVEVVSVTSFSGYFITYDRYLVSRKAAAFGSAVNPITGEKDNIKYVPVKYKHNAAGRQYTVAEIGERLLSGLHVILLGEYGSGKSRCIEELFDYISDQWGDTYQFPFAINLRENWGLQRSEELIRRHMQDLGLDDMEGPSIRCFRQRNSLFLLDGFDELGMQSWSASETKLKQLRAAALSGVRDIAMKSGTGVLVAGREHYFSSQAEMFEAIGLREADTIILVANDQFTIDEMGAYFESAELDIAIPSWLPRRPLICQTIAQLDGDEVDRMFGTESMEAVFWKHFMMVICERDARINQAFSADNIYNVFIELSRLTRTKSANVGPINPRELQVAFEAVVGAYPVENAAVMLQRLPSLGRIGTESTDRQFVDTYILDGLRAIDVAGAVDYDEVKRKQILDDSWANPLRRLGQVVLSYEMRGSEKRFLSLARRAAEGENRTLAADIVSSFTRDSAGMIDFEELSVSGGSFSDFDMSRAQIARLTIVDSTFEEVVLPNTAPNNVNISNCLIGKLSGAASIHGLPGWLSPAGIDQYDSVKTVSRIRTAGLSRQHEILVAIIKKTFFQPGAGRKEEALIRGFGTGQSANLVPKILNLLIREKVLSKFRGDEGAVYKPERAQSKRMGDMLEQLRNSEDELWKTVAAL